MLRPTEDQWKAITALRSDVVVTAGAGSGKTWVLTERYAAMLNGRPTLPPPEDTDAPIPTGAPCRPGEIIAITFTEAAAADMRRKIRARLRQLIEAGETRLLPYEEELETAPISTIHSYCAALIRRYPFEAGVDPDFVVLDEPEARRILRESAQEAILEALKEEEPAIRTALLVYGETGAMDLVLQLGTTWREEDRTGAEVWAVSRESLAREAKRWLQVREALLDAGRRMVEDGQKVSSTTKAYEKIMKFAASWPEMEEALASWDGRVTEDWEERLRRLDKEMWSGNAPKVLGDAVAEWKAAVKAAAEAVQAADLPEVTEGLCRLWDRVARRYEEKKAGHRALDYTDLQLRAVRLLEDSEVRRHWIASLRYVMVDEFQDTNRLQARLVGLLLDGGARLFVVGDGKQSIYRFRGADVSVFVETRQQVQEKGGVAVSLRHNFRSQGPILDFVNRVLGPVMGESANRENAAPQSSTIEYEPLVPTREKMGGSVEIVHIDSEGLAGRLVEATEAARWIRRFVQSGGTVGDESGPRPARYGDVAMLLAVSTHLPVYELALQEAGVPYRIAGSRNFFRRQEVRDLIQVLRWVYDPGDEVAMIGALRSPLFGMSDDGLTIIALAAGRGKESGLLAFSADPLGWVDGSHKLPLSPWDRRAAEDAARQVAKWRRRAAWESAGALVERIVDETGIVPTLLQTSGGRQKAENVRRFIEMAYEREAEGRVSLSAFLSWIQWQIEDDTDEEEAQVVDGADAVTVMTVHQSKGLEFPVVVLPDLARPFRSRREMWCMDEDGALAVKWPGVGEYAGFGWYERVREGEARKDREEEMRKFYVALTRARDHLALFGTRKLPSKKKDPLTVDQARSWFDWLICSLAQGDLSGAEELVGHAGEGVIWTRVIAPDGAAGFIDAARPQPKNRGVSEDRPGEGPEVIESFDSGAQMAEGQAKGEAARLIHHILTLGNAEGGWDREDFVITPGGGPLGRPEMATVSASRLLEYDICPRRYYYHWALRLPALDQAFETASGDGVPGEQEIPDPEMGGDQGPAEIEGVGWSPLLRGTVVHRVCERWTGAEPILDRLDQVLEEFRLMGPLGRRAREEVREELLRYADGELSKRLNRAQRVWSEWPFYLRLQGAERVWDLHGQVDKIFVADGRTVVVDFKTNRTAPDGVGALVDHYRFQVQLYAWAVGRNLAPVDEAYLYFTDPGVLAPVPVDPENVREALERVDARLNHLSREWRIEAYPFTEDLSMCRVCPYRAICPGFARGSAGG
ncbi:UvrD-helicase domain-containing protein [Kyrpidia spormannii]|uniref:DNA 3'-5' helicase n=1 Tax=Kyrpidia spormannii TaxID=2055160 RepID=A0A6F9E1W1_9BACL|nr:UvrD-helicase domain-containing protein [Kyrpidia spormannii]CAB3390812.1 conserved protein of unknown function [Kyrpidia spormannii]